MKKSLGLFLVILFVVAAAGGFVFWKGNQPKITYYENGQIKTLVQRHFFRENGEYSKYNEDGTLSQQYTLLEGTKIGTAHIYGDHFVLDVSYLDGKLFGPIKINTNQADPEVEKVRINVGEGMTFSAYADESDDFRIDGKIKCDDETLFDNIQKALKQKTAETVRAALNCLSWNKLLLQDEDFKCSYEGDYQYPKFNEDSHLSCKGFGKLAELKDAYMGMYMGGEPEENAKDTPKGFNVSAGYSVADKALNISVESDDASYKQVQTYKGFEDVTESLLNFGFSAQEGKDLVKLVVDILKNLTISESTSIVDGKKIADVQGDFNVMNGFSNPWAASFYDADGSVSSQLKVTDKGVMINTGYPISKKQMFALSLQINDSFKTKYHNLLDKVISEFETKEPEQAVQGITEVWPQYAMDFTDVMQSINMILYNNKGEKVIAGVVSTKKGADLNTLMMTPAVALDVKIITYKDSKVNKVITGNLTDGFMVDGKKVPIDNLVEYIDTDALEKVVSDIEAEFKEAYKDSEQKIKEGKMVSDPFMTGFYSGYTKAMEKYKNNKIKEQVLIVPVNVRTIFGGQDDYSKLDDELINRYKVIPGGSLSEDGKNINALDGVVNIYPSGKDSEEDKKAFVVEFQGLPNEMCINLATESWNFDGFIAMGVNVPVDDKYIEVCGPKDGVVCARDGQMSAYDAYENCLKDNNNTIYWKYF